MSDFSTVEELASIIKDNLPCKHLVLSVEEMLIDALQNGTDSNGMIELEPMSSYHRLMLHRLADIFGFAHESVGEGDDRHLVLQKCPDSSMPLVLVSDILLQYDECPPSTSSAYILKRENSSEGTESKVITSTSLLPVGEREMAYIAARERIFSMNGNSSEESINPKPRPVPAAARRMIIHALGQPKSSSSQKSTQESTVNSSKLPRTMEKNPLVRHSKNGNLERERAGAAKRIFANALGLGSTRKNQPS